MSEAKKNIWRPIAIIALAIALIACGAVAYLMNRAPEKEIVKEVVEVEVTAVPVHETPAPRLEPTKAPLSLWTEGALAKDSLMAYMDTITSQGVGYIPPEDRIAVFDLDGTLFCETDPVYFDYSLLLYRVTQDPDYIDKASDFERQTAKKIQDMILTGKSAAGLEVDHGKSVASAFAGMTIAEFEAYCKTFRDLPARGYEGMTIGESFYRPMLEVVDYLVENDFKVYVVSGTDRLIVRGIVKDSLLPVPAEQIIGSDETLVARSQGEADGLDYVFTDGDDVVLGGDFIVKNLKMNKVTVILQEIGKQPVLSFGNSTGDASMAEFVTSDNPYPSMAFMLCCDDEVRENGSAAKAEKMEKLCAEYDWVPISMRDDWTTIYGEGVVRKVTPDNVIFDIPERIVESDVKLSDDVSDFVLLSDAVPDAILEIRYYSTYNFIGDRIDGYEEPLALLTKEAAAALKEVSDELVGMGYRLKIFDAYRPQRAVTNFMTWALDPDDARMKEYFYPELEKSELFPQGYIAEHSGHSRGSTVDLTLFDMKTEREVDMGGTFDYFGELSHPDYTEITEAQYAMRMLLREVMVKHGFRPLEEEWWHFTLENEPFPDTYFTFPINSDSLGAPKAEQPKAEELHAAVQQTTDSPAWVTDLPAARDENTRQLFVVAGMGKDKTTASVSMHQRRADGIWKQILSTPAYVGRKGLCLDADHREGCGQTPIGIYRFNKAFGIAADPGCAIPYVQVDDNTYWSGDPDRFYNQMVDIREVPDLVMDDSEHIVDYTYQYQYCLNISFNEKGTPGRGSAIFLHCLGPARPYTGGCVAVPEYIMKLVMQSVTEDCVVVIDTLENLGGSL